MTHSTFYKKIKEKLNLEEHDSHIIQRMIEDLSIYTNISELEIFEYISANMTKEFEIYKLDYNWKNLKTLIYQHLIKMS